jgi:Ser/Thr protein kinase RdoA (MazF antagonist)
MSLSHFPDPDMHDYRDARLQEDVWVVPDSVIEAYELDDAAISDLDTGSYNIHFRVERAGELFDLRRSNRPNSPGNLGYEAAILVHLRQSGFDLAPEIVPALTGEPNVWLEGAGWTLFRWMGDGPKINRQTANPTRTLAAARALARLHVICKDFVPDGQRGDWPIFTLPTVDPNLWLHRAESLADLLDEHAVDSGEPHGRGEQLRVMSRQSASELATVDFTALPEYVCHGDYRVRNIMFAGDEVTAVFDFDTSIRASRLPGLGGVVTRFSALGGNPQADIEAGALFLKEYHNRLPLSAYEITVLPIFIRWRLLRDVVIYYDRWWLQVGETAAALFDCAGNEIVVRAGLD